MSVDKAPLAFLFDVDNTLLDNDGVRRDLEVVVEGLVGSTPARRFWKLYEEVRRDLDYVDFPHTLERFRLEFPDEAGFPALVDAVLAYPYRTAAFPRAHDVLRHAGAIGPVAILSDGDPVYQPVTAQMVAGLAPDQMAAAIAAAGSSGWSRPLVPAAR